MSVGAPASDLPSLPAAAEWLAAVITGSVATIVAVIAVAALGVWMLAGRVPARRGGVVIIGCFVLFAARDLASALFGAVGGDRDASAASIPQAPPAYRPAVPTPVPYDPYAGASVPRSAPGEIPLR